MFSYGMCSTLPLHNLGSVFIKGINKDHNDSSNGSGKSSILNTIREILFGKNDTPYSGKYVINNHVDWKNGFFGALWLEDRDHVDWRILVLNKWSGDPPDASIEGEYKGTDIYLDRWDGQQWMDERPTSMGNKKYKDTQIKIVEQIVGMTYDQFSAYVCLGQKAESALISGTSSGREKIIQAVADISIWDNSVQILNGATSIKASELTLQEATISGLQNALDTFTVPSDEDIAKAQSDIDSTQEGIKNTDVETANIMELLTTERQLEQDAHKKIADIQQEIDLLTAEERQALEKYQHYKDPEAPKELKALQVKQVELNQSVNELHTKSSDYSKQGEGKCSTCGQKITAKYLDNEITKLSAKIEDVNIAITSTTDKIHKLQSAYSQDVIDSKKIADDGYAKEIASIADTKADKLTDMPNLDVTRSKIGSLNDKHMQLVGHKTLLQNQLIMVQNAVNELLSRKKEYEDTVLKLENLKLEKDQKEIEIKHYKWVERNFKKVKLQEYESVIIRLNHLVNIELSAIWGPGLNVRFVTAKQKSRGTGVKQELDILIETPNKPSVPIGMYSGGELKAVVIAVFRAMRQLSHERGLGVNISAIDELDKDLDDHNTDSLVNIFSMLSKDSPTCFTISHNSRLLNTMSFDRVWTVVKENEFSTIEVTA